MDDIDNMSKDELLELRDSLVGDRKTGEELKIDPRILAAVKMLEISFDNSRAYSDTIDTEEKRIEQIDRIQDALDSASHKENAALCKSHKYRRY